MTKKQSKQTAPNRNQHEQECCELYGEYCYPCSVSEPSTGKKNATPTNKHGLRG